MKNLYDGVKCLLAVTFFFLAVPSKSQNFRPWATYYGGLSRDGGFSVATDNNGNVFMAGITGSGNNIAAGGFQNNFGGGVVDAYVVKFDSSGGRSWGTYYGGTGDEMTFFGGKMCVATDLFGNVYLAGLTNSSTGIASGGFQNTMLGTESGYLAKFDPSGNRLWGTYYGGSFAYGFSVATDEAGNVYLAGSTGSATDIAFNGYQNTLNGTGDAYLVKFDASGNRLWATYFGGPGTDDGYTVATDKDGNVYLAGFTNSTSGIAFNGAQNSYGGGSYDDFLVKFNSSGTRLWSTYYGGSGDEMALFAGDLGVAADAFGNVYLTGLTTSTNGIASGGFQNNIGGGTDAFLAKFDASGALQWGTYYGGPDEDRGYSVAVDEVGDVYMVGRTSSGSNISSGGIQNNYGGGQDAFIVKFDPAGNRLCASYYGSTGVDDCNAVATGKGNAVYLAGGTENISGISWNGFQSQFGGAPFDGMLVKFYGCSSMTGIQDQLPASLAVHFNSSTKMLFIAENSLSNGTLRVYDMFGRQVFRSENVSERGVFHLEISKGIYTAEVTDGEKSFTEKFSVE